MKIVIPAYGRHELTRRVALYYDDIGADAIIVETPDKEGNLSGVEDYVVEQHRDEKGDVLVGRKFNDALEYAANFDEDVILTGSDSLLSPKYLREIEQYNGEYMEISGCHFFDPTSMEMIYIPGFVCGSGKYMSKNMLDTCGWRPYDDKKSRNVDDGPHRHVPHSRVRYINMYRDPACLEIRNKENMWGIDWVRSQQNATILSAHDCGTIFQRTYGQKVSWWTSA